MGGIERLEGIHSTSTPVRLFYCPDAREEGIVVD